MKIAILLICAALPALAVEIPTEREVDQMRESIRTRAGDGEATLLAACAFGYAACGSAAKANACTADLRARYPSSPALKLIAPGFVSMPCRECYGLPVRCGRCGGKGELAMMAGSQPSRCVVCGGSGILKAGCKVCRDTNRDAMPKDACARLYRCIVSDESVGIVLESKPYIDFLCASVECARARMSFAVRIKGIVEQRLSGGALVHLKEISGTRGPSEDKSLIFVATSERLSPDALVSRFAFQDETYEYTTTYGNEMSVDRYLLSPWYGLLKPQSVKGSETVMGIPRAEYDRIKADALRRYPQDYGMQKFVIDQGIHDYKAMQAMP